MTDDSQGAARGYGPSHTEAEPTAHLVRHDESAQPGHDADHGGQAGQIAPSGETWTQAPTSGSDSRLEEGPHYPSDAVPISGAGIGQVSDADLAGTADPRWSTGQTSGGPAGPAWSAGQTSGGPAGTADPTWSADQTSGAPAGSTWSAGQTSGGPADSARDPYGLGPDPWDSRFTPSAATRLGPRIEPSPPPNRRRLILGLVAGLVAGLLVFGTGGFILGRTTASAGPAPRQTGSPAPSATGGALPIYEQSQVAINQPKFTGGVATLAQGWLPYLSGCSRSGQSGGPALNAGEKVRVRCTLGGMSAIFVEYATVTDRDKARVKALGQNVDARTLTPGVAAATDKPAPSGRTTGNYVEYAYQVTERDAVRTVSGIRWDDDQAPVGASLLAYWTDGIGSDWAPMRDLWGRYA